ncbi:MAG: HutD family protein [Crocinitomicaceae bacterium]|nr:HutD family protein [Crocinitomicaceae bacterium]
MAFEIIRKSDIKTAEWSGGITEELYIFPRKAVFKKGNYDVRISIATVKTETSVFTPLTGVSRILTVLEGELHLAHEGHHSVHLKPLEQDTFQGDWMTRSSGKVTNFNVMTKNGIVASVKPIKVDANETIPLNDQSKIDFVYVISGKLSYGQELIGQGESIVITRKNNAVSLVSNESTSVIRVTINQK